MTKPTSTRGVVVQFPVAAVKLAQARRRYHQELERFERAVYRAELERFDLGLGKAKKPRFNKRILAAYHEARGAFFD
jgi:hypothetical protein